MSIYDEVRPETAADERRDQARENKLNEQRFLNTKKAALRAAERQRKASPRTEIEALRDEVLLLRTRVASLEIHSKQ